MSENSRTINTIQVSNAEFIPKVIELLEEGHTVTLPLRGYSMRPFLENNRDKGLLEKAEHIQVGDAVLAEVSPKKYVLHRVIRIQGEEIILRGDGNIGTEHCQIKDVKGLAIGFYRKGRVHLDRTDGMKWKVYSWIWTPLFPIRRYLLAFYRRIWLRFFKPI